MNYRAGGGHPPVTLVLSALSCTDTGSSQWQGDGSKCDCQLSHLSLSNCLWTHKTLSIGDLHCVSIGDCVLSVYSRLYIVCLGVTTLSTGDLHCVYIVWMCWVFQWCPLTCTYPTRSPLRMWLVTWSSVAAVRAFFYRNHLLSANPQKQGIILTTRRRISAAEPQLGWPPAPMVRRVGELVLNMAAACGSARWKARALD